MLEFANPQTWSDMMAKHGRSTANPRIENKREQVQKWMMQEGWKIAEIHGPDSIWAVTGTNDNGHVVVVAQPKNVLDRTILQGSVNIGEDHQKRIAGMDAKARESLLWKLRFGLLETGLEFQGLSEPLRMIQLGQRIYDDGLTKDAFVQRVTQVKRGIIFVIWTIQRALEQPADDALDSEFLQ